MNVIHFFFVFCYWKVSLKEFSFIVSAELTQDVKGCGLGSWGVFPERARSSSLHHYVQTGSRDHVVFYSQVVSRSFNGVDGAGYIWSLTSTYYLDYENVEICSHCSYEHWASNIGDQIWRQIYLFFRPIASWTRAFWIDQLLCLTSNVTKRIFTRFIIFH